MLEEIKLTLLENMQIEKEEGQNFDAESAANARLARKQYKETAELMLQVTADIEKGAR